MANYRRGSFINKSKVIYTWNKAADTGLLGKFVKTLIVRGIGYRAFALNNDFLNKNNLADSFVESLRPIYSALSTGDFHELTQVGSFEFSKNRYIMVRAGHTRDLAVPMHNLVACTTSKKDRKLVIMSQNKVLAANLARCVHLYRAPSVYTGRGVRIKHIRPLRKAGKKDKQRGKAF